MSAFGRFVWWLAALFTFLVMLTNTILVLVLLASLPNEKDLITVYKFIEKYSPMIGIVTIVGLSLFVMLLFGKVVALCGITLQMQPKTRKRRKADDAEDEDEDEDAPPRRRRRPRRRDEDDDDDAE